MHFSSYSPSKNTKKRNHISYFHGFLKGFGVEEMNELYQKMIPPVKENKKDSMVHSSKVKQSE